MASLNLDYLLKSLSPNTVTLGVKAATYETGRGAHVSPQQCVT